MVQVGFKRTRLERLTAMATLLLVVAFLFIPLSLFAREPTWESLEAKGAVIAGIEVKVTNVFDPSNPDERYWLARAANFVHVETRKAIVGRELLFKAGDKVDARRIHETERNLRALEFVRDASIVPVGVSNGTVWARVLVRDAWSLKGGLRFSHVGGQTAWRVRVHEVNLFGLGKQLAVSHDKNQERTTDMVAYSDPQLFGSRWTLSTNYQSLSDGKARLFQLKRPYFAIDTPWSMGVQVASEESHLTLYNREHAVYAFPDKRDSIDLSWSRAYCVKERSALRLGLELVVRQARYGPMVTYRTGYLREPDVRDRRLRGLALRWSLDQDRYAAFEDLAAVSRTEDINLGWSLSVAAGLFSRAMGSAENAPFGEMTLQKGWMAGDDTLLLWSGKTQGRHHRDGWRDALVSQELTLYNQSLSHQTLAVSLSVDGALRPDPENWLYLGGTEGMRGYGDHFRAGDRRWVLSMEDRVITDWTWWGLVQVGFVAYADAGAIRRFDTGSWSKTYADVGAGLRFGNLKSAFGRVIQFTVAVPLVREPGMDTYQIVVGNVVRF